MLCGRAKAQAITTRMPAAASWESAGSAASPAWRQGHDGQGCAKLLTAKPYKNKKMNDLGHRAANEALGKRGPHRTIGPADAATAEATAAASVAAAALAGAAAGAGPPPFPPRPAPAPLSASSPAATVAAAAAAASATAAVAAVEVAAGRAASAQLVCALRAGLTGCLEQLLRRAGADPACPEARLPDYLLLEGGEAHNHRAAMQLLAGPCEPRPAAALVATVGKLLRVRAAPGALLAAGLREGPGPRLGRGLVGLAFTVVGDLRGSVERSPLLLGREPAAGVAPISPMQWLAACEWLPPLFRLAGAMEAAAGRASAAPALESVAKCWVVVLRWMPLLARRAWWAAARAAGSSGSGAGSGGAQAGLCAAWRSLLLGRLGCVAVLGVALRALLPSTVPVDRARVAENLAESCCCVAAAYPAEVRAAALAAEAAAEAAAAAASSSRSSSRKRAGPKAGGGKGAAGKGGVEGVAAVEAASGWRPRHMRTLAKELRSAGRDRAAAAVEALAVQLERWIAAGGEGVGSEEVERAVKRLPALPFIDAAARLLPARPDTPDFRLRACDNPACDNLAGESEAGQGQQACMRCGAAWYCRPECKAAHWDAPGGHKEACGAGGPARELKDGRAAG
ncbi:hypothetical protein TSOC_004962 [Tetrabaena socialis]|uniref:MYND-type domain-containing protein n=1 Tax=Tetrabaena socialis TaxID=47790 RepID=A0A2J8A7H9_9CHLO|nr:hypothetical protein TSOC_004962 [Tetrabaena socialis]|eukprot:PNH08489.1 hypothetical protein TSOC_004962 [Tetrabaena socialis]